MNIMHFQDFLAANSMNIPENWEYVKSQIDVNEVMNYLITEIYCDNVNWPIHKLQMVERKI